MAIEVMVAVLQESRSTATDRLVLLALANEASKVGELSAYARSRTYLCASANCSLSTMKRSLTQLVALGELEITKHGDGRKQSCYLIHLPSMCRKRRCKTHPGGGSELTPLNLGVAEPAGGPDLNPLGVQDRPPHHPVVMPVLTPSSSQSSVLQEPAVQSSDGLTIDTETATLTTPTPPELDDTNPGSGMLEAGSVDPETWRKLPDWAKGAVRPTEAAKPTPAAESSSPPEVARSNADERWRHSPIRTARMLEKLLQEGHGVTVSARQDDQRNLSKLLDLKPTVSQLDGACNALKTSEGSLTLGRLVARWDVLKEFAAKRPDKWDTKRTRQRDQYENHIAAGGDPYGYDGKVEYQ